ncbi:MAG TPA: nucleotidyltransferase domain-containing protein [Thermoanaerobaculia bacterium]
MGEFATRFDQRGLNEFCRRWNIAELGLFGSALGDRFREDSDVDLLVTFEPGTTRTFSDWMDMVFALEALFGRKVDLVEQRFLTNPFRRKSILSSRKIIYAAWRSSAPPPPSTSPATPSTSRHDRRSDRACPSA